MTLRNQGLAQQLQTSNLQLRRLQTELYHLRTSVWRNPSTENSDEEISETSGNNLIVGSGKYLADGRD